MKLFGEKPFNIHIGHIWLATHERVHYYTRGNNVQFGKAPETILKRRKWKCDITTFGFMIQSARSFDTRKLLRYTVLR